MGRLGAILIIILDVWAILDVVKSDRNTEQKAIWILIILILPLLGPLAWFLVSRRYINF